MQCKTRHKRINIRIVVWYMEVTAYDAILPVEDDAYKVVRASYVENWINMKWYVDN